MKHWAVDYLFHSGGRTPLVGKYQPERLDPVKAARGARGRVSLYPLSKQAEDICEVNGTESLVWTMVEIDHEEQKELEALDD